MHEPGGPPPKGLLKGHRSTVTTIAVARRRVYSGSLDGTVRCWCYHSFECLRQLQLEGNIANSLAVAFARVYVCTSDRVVTVYDADELKLLTRLEGHSAYVYCVASRASKLAQPTRALIQNEHPHFPMPTMATQALRFDSYPADETAARFVVVTIGVRKVHPPPSHLPKPSLPPRAASWALHHRGEWQARDLEAADASPDQPGSSDPFCEVTAVL